MIIHHTCLSVSAMSDQVLPIGIWSLAIIGQGLSVGGLFRIGISPTLRSVVLGVDARD